MLQPSRMLDLHNLPVKNISQSTQDQEYQNIIYYLISKTKEFDNKTNDRNTIRIMGKEIFIA